jgi:hypothetical protein
MGQPNIPASPLVDLLILQSVYTVSFLTTISHPRTHLDIVDTTAFLHTLALASKSYL